MFAMKMGCGYYWVETVEESLDRLADVFLSIIRSFRLNPIWYNRFIQVSRQVDVHSVGLVGRREVALKKAKDWIQSPKVKLHALDILEVDETKRLMQEYDVSVITLPDRRTSYKVVDLAIQVGLNVVDMLEEYYRRPDPYEIEGLQSNPSQLLQ